MLRARAARARRLETRCDELSADRRPEEAPARRYGAHLVELKTALANLTAEVAALRVERDALQIGREVRSGVCSRPV